MKGLTVSAAIIRTNSLYVFQSRRDGILVEKAMQKTFELRQERNLEIYVIHKQMSHPKNGCTLAPDGVRNLFNVRILPRFHP